MLLQFSPPREKLVFHWVLQHFLPASFQTGPGTAQLNVHKCIVFVRFYKGLHFQFLLRETEHGNALVRFSMFRRGQFENVDFPLVL